MPATALQALVADTPRRLLRSKIGLNTDDPKLPATLPVVYAVSADRDSAQQACGEAAEVRGFDLQEGQKNFLRPQSPQGLLYLPYPYLVPGGRFNEMYGWDTAFPVFAWAAEHPQLMREQVDNQLYQIRAYGKVLNANRTYYLSRSQPPLIAAMVAEVWKAAQQRPWKEFDKNGVHADARTWLAGAYDDLKKYYAYWTTGERLAHGGPLSRYWDEGDGPAVEVVSSEPGHYDHAKKHFLKEPDARFYDDKNDLLTPLYYRADRSMRASGLDPTGHWGYGGLKCIFHAPLCLNALLYRMESDLAGIAAALGDDTPWKQRQSVRLAAMNELMLEPETHIYHDYDFDAGKRNLDPFATFFHALWAGLYDSDTEKARWAARTILARLETPFGVSTSTRNSGSQWDHPYGWPPLQYFAFEGLWRCGMKEEARRVARKYVDLTLRVFADKGSLFEKYNVKDGSAEVHVVHGYNINVSERGTFLWTAAVLQLAQELLERKA